MLFVCKWLPQISHRLLKGFYSYSSGKFILPIYQQWEGLEHGVEENDDEEEKHSEAEVLNIFLSSGCCCCIRFSFFKGELSRAVFADPIKLTGEPSVGSVPGNALSSRLSHIAERSWQGSVCWLDKWKLSVVHINGFLY